jgi:PKD repeat protein
MATYFVDGQNGNDSGDGSTNRPWKSIGKAASSVRSGDEVRIRTGVYHETLRLNTSNTKWVADTGHKPAIDGRYHEGLFDSKGNLPNPKPGMGFHPENPGGNMVLLSAERVVLDGLTFRNCAGTAVSISASNCVVRNCRIDFIYATAIRISGSGYKDNCIIENNICTRMSVQHYDPNRTGAGPARQSGAIVSVESRDSVFRNNVVAYCHGQGIAAARGSLRLTIEGNIVHTCGHVHLYNTRGRDTVIRNNLVYHLYIPVFMPGNGYPPAGIAWGDEGAASSFPHSSGGQIYNNIVIGLGILFDVRNNTNYSTQLKDFYIGYNTFIGLKMTRFGISINGNIQGRPHINALFENNLIFNAQPIGRAAGNISAVSFRNNLWGTQPPEEMRGPGDRIGNPNLTNPLAPLISQFPSPDSNMDPRNYQLTSRSTLAISMASDGSRANGIQPPTISKDFYGASRDAKPDIGAHEYLGATEQIAANFSIGPGQTAGQVPHTVDFTDKSTSTRPIVSHLWEFGDGETATEANASHTYTEAGSYDVSLTVTNDQGQSDKITQVGVVSVVQLPSTVIPTTFRRFILRRVADNQVLAFGTQYPDLHCVLVWNEEPFHILNYADIEEVQQDHTEDETVELVWLDSEDEDQFDFLLDLNEESLVLDPTPA